jgi:hypothetical protein
MFRCHLFLLAINGCGLKYFFHVTLGFQFHMKKLLRGSCEFPLKPLPHTSQDLLWLTPAVYRDPGDHPWCDQRDDVRTSAWLPGGCSHIPLEDHPT